MSVVPIARANGHSFEEFWQLVPGPRKAQKVLCKAKWDKITSKDGLETCTLDKDSGKYVSIWLHATPEEIIAGMKRDCQKWRGTGSEIYGWRDGGRFIPNPATWLNQGRWMDG